MHETVDVRVEGFDDHVVLVLPRKMDDCMVPWQDAWRLGEILELAAKETPTKPLITDPGQVRRESSQIKLNTYKDLYVVLLFEHTDRIRLGPEAAILVARAIRLKAQDLDLLNNKGVRMTYKNGHHIPQWSFKRRIF